MLEFKKLELADIPTIKPFMGLQGSRMCDCTIGACVMWREYFNTEFALYDNSLIFKVRYLDGKVAFPYPSGAAVDGALEKIREIATNEGLDLEFVTVSAKALENLKSKFKVTDVKSERDWYDYVYNTEDLQTLAGRKFSGQRNHINKFKKLYDYEFLPVDQSNLSEVKEFFVKFAPEHAKDSETYDEETVKVIEVLDNYEIYGLQGGILKVAGKIVAMAIGETLGDTLFVHIEKADREYQGSYQMIVNEFAKMYATQGIDYINREEDVGDEGLRRSKLSYHPEFLVEKFVVEVEI